MEPAQIEAAVLYNLADRTGFHEMLTIGRTNLSIGILDKDEVEAEGAAWEEIEPYIRVLGVTSKNVWEANGQSDREQLHSEIPNLEIEINRLYQSFQNILGKDPEVALAKIHKEVHAFNDRFEALRHKQNRCLEAHHKNIEKIAEELEEIIDIIEENKTESLELQELNLSIDIAELRRTVLGNDLENSLYNERTVPALKFIRSQLDSALNEKTQLKNVLSAAVESSESNPQLKRMVAQYSELLRAIAAKQRDIDNLG